MKVVGVLLAAGCARRFGSDKLLAPLPRGASDVPAGTSVGASAAAHLVAALPEVVAVVRAADAQLAERLRETGLRTVVCANADQGMGASLACGVAATERADGWVIALADMPWIAPATIRAVASAIATGADIAAATYRGERGHPVGFSSRHYPALVALTGDTGARSLIARARDAIRLIECDDPGVTRDIDTPGDLLQCG